jgi:hypothetical protein
MIAVGAAIIVLVLALATFLFRSSPPTPTIQPTVAVRHTPVTPQPVPSQPSPQPNYVTGCAYHVIENYEIGDEWTPYPGHCRVRFIMPKGACIMYRETASSSPEGPYGNCAGAKSDRIATIRAKFIKNYVAGAAFRTNLIVDQPTE